MKVYMGDINPEPLKEEDEGVEKPINNPVEDDDLEDFDDEEDEEDEDDLEEEDEE